MNKRMRSWLSLGVAMAMAWNAFAVLGFEAVQPDGETAESARELGTAEPEAKDWSVPRQDFASVAEEKQPGQDAETLAFEDVSRREENVKTYYQGGGQYQAVIYPYAVHYKDGEEWKEIDNSLVSEKTPDGQTIYTNKENDLDVYFADTLSGDEAQTTVKKDQYELSWAIERVEKNASPVEKAKAATDATAVSGGAAAPDGLPEAAAATRTATSYP